MASTGYDKLSERSMGSIETASFTLSEIQDLIRSEVFAILLQIKDEIETKVRGIDEEIKQIKSMYMTKEELDGRIRKIENEMEELGRGRGRGVNQSEDMIVSKSSSSAKRINNGVNLSEILFPFGATFMKELEDCTSAMKPLPRILVEDFVEVSAKYPVR